MSEEKLNREEEKAEVKTAEKIDLTSEKNGKDSRGRFKRAGLPSLMVLLVIFLGVLTVGEGYPPPTKFVALILEIFVSAYTGYAVLPRFFRNEELEKYQTTVLSSVIPIFKAKTKENVHFAISEAISSIVGNIDKKLIESKVKDLQGNIKSFIISLQNGDTIMLDILDDTQTGFKEIKSKSPKSD